MADILVVDDDQSIATAFERFLQHEGHSCTVASNVEDAVRLVGEIDPDLVVMDIRMPGVDGLQGLEQLRGRYPGVDVVMMTAYGTSQTSIDAIRGGAFEYLTKPLDLDQLRSVIGRALAARESRRRAVAPGVTEPEGTPQLHVGLVGETPAMQDVYKMIGRLATIDVPALVVGEQVECLVQRHVRQDDRGNALREPGDRVWRLTCAGGPQGIGADVLALDIDGIQ